MEPYTDVRAYWRIREGHLENVKRHKRQKRRWYRKPVTVPTPHQRCDF